MFSVFFGVHEFVKAKQDDPWPSRPTFSTPISFRRILLRKTKLVENFSEEQFSAKIFPPRFFCSNFLRPPPLQGPQPQPQGRAGAPVAASAKFKKKLEKTPEKTYFFIRLLFLVLFV